MYKAPGVSTDLEAFLFIKNHLLNQKARSLAVYNEESATGGCAYRGEDGKMCAIGCLISDEYYDSSLEGMRASSERILNAISLSNPNWELDDRDYSLITNLQSVHDIKDPEIWESALHSAYINLRLKERNV